MAKSRINGGAYKIETGIPVPSKGNPRTYGVTDLMRRMKPGESALLPQYKTTLSAGAVRMAARLLRPEGFEFTMRTVDGGVRLWRVS